MAGTCGKAGGEHPHLEHGSTAAPAGRRAVKMASSKAVLSQEIGWYTIDALARYCTVWGRPRYRCCLVLPKAFVPVQLCTCGLL